MCKLLAKEAKLSTPRLDGGRNAPIRCAMATKKEALDDWAGWTDEQLVDYEFDLYEREASGEDTWEMRNEVLWEMNRRNMMRPKAHQ